MEAGTPERHSVRAAHEKHVTGHTGCQWYEVLLVLYPVYPSVVILGALSSDMHGRNSQHLRTVVEMLVCVVPVVAAQTASHNHLAHLAAGLTLAAAVAACAARWRAVSAPSASQVSRIATRGRDSLTLLRAVVGISTAVAILAVDFHVFPRRFAKTEEFGWSVMDAGAASFLLINALVDQRYAARLSYRSVVRESSVLLLLGFVRLVSLSATDYQQHASEYGSHCNFFFVLAFTKMLCARWCSGLSAEGAAAAACCATAVQHFSTTQLQHWVLSAAPRDTFLSSNRESVVGATGYVALYCWGAALGKLLLGTKSDKVSQATVYQHSSTVVARGCAVAAAAVGCVLWCVVAVVQVQPSRRLVNAPFIIWMVFILLFFGSLSSAIEAYLKSLNFSSDVVPRVLRAVNSRQLLFFLASNLLTGVINLTLDTLAVRAPWDTIIVLTYTVILCCGVSLLQDKSFDRATQAC